MNAKLFIPLFCLLISFQLFADDKNPEIVPQYYVKDTHRDSSLKLSEALFNIQFFDGSTKKIPAPIKFSYNGIQKTSVRNAEGKTSLKVKPGKYRFMFYYDSEHLEITTDSIEIKPGFVSELAVHFHSSIHIEVMKKPVIYLYPETTRKISVKLNMTGALSFTYPEYKNGWNVIADKSGTLTSEGKKYDYLFWEGNTTFRQEDLDKKTGFVVTKENTVKFLEEKLSAMGLNAREQEDFITYWAPQMIKNECNFIHFLFNEELNQYAQLNIEPHPDKLFRVFMIWEKASVTDTDHVQAQTIPVLDRKGFCVLEWGGTELNPPQITQIITDSN